jgi:tRNA threonylcarbamoyladenosine biosynthesis protein TsaB
MLIEHPNSSYRRLDGLRLLSICTSTAKASVFASSFNDIGQLTAGSLVFQDHGRESASMIFRLIDQALEQANLAEFDLLTFDKGPGAFTGVRIGCGVAQGLGFGKSIPVIGVNALAAQAMQIARSKALANHDLAAEGQLCGIAIDARMGEVYCAVYQVKLAQAQEQITVLAPTVCSAEQAALLFDHVLGNHVETQMSVGGNGFSQQGLHQSLFEWASNRSSAVEIDHFVDLDAEKIAFLAVATVQAKLRQSGSSESCQAMLKDNYPASLAAPEYVRNNVALDKSQQAQLRLERAR